MAFELEKFSPAGANSDKGIVPQQFSYISTIDSIAQMKAAGYFNEAAFQLFANDMISAIASDGMVIFHVTSSAVVVGAATVVVDSNVISNQGGSDSSASFHNVYKLTDFPVPVGNLITLENGVNYLIYIPGPISSNLSFVLPTDYSKGGSLIYMGGRGVLEWNYTGGSTRFIDAVSLVGGGVFTIKDLSFNDVNKISGAAIRISGAGPSDTFDRLEITNCEFNEFRRGFDLENIDKCVFDQADIFMLSGINQTAPSVELENIRVVEAKNCLWQAISLSENVMVVVSGLERAHFDNVTFRININSVTSIFLAPDLVPDNFIKFSNCVVLKQDGSIGGGFGVDVRGPIQSIKTAGGGEIEITTFEDHGLTTASEVTLYGTLNYNNIIAAQVRSKTDKTFKVDGSVLADNFAGFFLEGSLDSYISNKLIVTDCLGIESPRQIGVCEVTQSTTVQDFTGANVFKTIEFSAGTIQLPPAGLAKDFIISDYTSMELQYVGLTQINAKVTLQWNFGQLVTTETFFLKFQVDSDSARESVVYEASSNQTGLNGFTYSCLMLMQPGDKIQPLIANKNNANNGVYKNVIFTVEV